MATPSPFDWAAEALERITSLNRLETRGILRLVLQKAGLDPKSLTWRELSQVVAGALHEDLERRGVRDAAAACKTIQAELPGIPLATAETSTSHAEAGRESDGLPSVFDWVSDALDTQSQMGRLQARGTLRLALKEAGLTAEDLDKEQAAAVLAQLMPQYLRSRAVGEGEAICTRIVADLSSAAVLEPSPLHESPEEVFARLGGRSARF